MELTARARMCAPLACPKFEKWCRTATMAGVRITASVPTVCATCKTAGELQVWQSIRDGNLTWSEEFSCNCGHAFEANEKGLPPMAIRKALLEAGEYELVLTSADGRAAGQKILKALLNVTERQSAAQLASIPAKMYVGTQVECMFVAEAMKRLGVMETRVEKVLGGQA